MRKIRTHFQLSLEEEMFRSVVLPGFDLHVLQV